MKRFAELAAYGLAAIGAVMVTVAGVWWLYQTIQDGITYSQVGNAGMALLFLAFMLWVLSRDRDSSDSLETMFRDHDE